MSIEQNASKEERLKRVLKDLLAKDEFKAHQEMVERLSKGLRISMTECAAALSLLNSPDFFSEQANELKAISAHKSVEQSPVLAKQKLVRYRLDIGRKHQISLDGIRKVLVEVSGVDKMRIGNVDIRNFYTLVDLPDGMTADIFQLLSETEVNQQRLNIKRVKYQRRFHRRNNSKG